MSAWLASDSALWSLFVASFVSATLLPGGSEILLYNIVIREPQQLWPALLLASTGNTLGAVLTYWLGRLAPRPKQLRALAWAQRYGAAALLVSWLPVFGDALVLAAGWLRIPPLAALLFIALGKFARYVAIVYAAFIFA